MGARIYLDATAMENEPSGVNRYCHNLVPRLVALAPEHEFIVLRAAGASGSLLPSGGAREIVLRWPRRDWANLIAKPALNGAFRRHGRPDLYHALFHLLPIGVRRGPSAPSRVVVTLHDLIWIDHAHHVRRNWIAAEWLRRFGGFAIPYALRSADHVICDSKTTAQRAASWVAADRRSTIYLGVDEAFFDAEIGTPASLAHVLDRGVPYVAALGVGKAYKNVQCLVRAFAALLLEWPHVHLVLIGGDGGILPEVLAGRLLDCVTVTPRVSDAELRSIIALSRMFIVPSLVEGFGLPALEAMAVGTPVAAADNPALNEITGDAAVHFDPLDPGQLTGILRDVLQNDALHRSLSERGRRRAAGFRWSVTAAQTLAVYEALLTAGSGRRVVS